VTGPELSPRFGVLGLGAMGLPIAWNLAAAGYEVRGAEVAEARRVAAAQIGVELADDLVSLVAWCTYLIVVLRDESQVWSAFFDEDGTCRIAAGRVVVIMSTLRPGTLAHLAAELERHDVTTIDAPILSGNDLAAREALLDIIVSGPPEPVATLAAALGSCGQVTILSETPGDAQAAKLTCQVMQAAGVAAALEGLRFAADFGLDEEGLVPLLQRGSARSWALDNLQRVRTMWERPGDPFDLIHKDLLAVLDEGRQRCVSLPVTAVLAREFQRSNNQCDESRTPEPGPRPEASS
jgi:L-threonate 2-dehydrogenase